MKKSSRQFIALSCALLLQLGLFASLAHAAQHPFHVQNELCASFIGFGQQDMSVDIAPVGVDFKPLSVELFIESYQPVKVALLFHYASRAPPVS